jgi:hypothetical protein
MHISQETQPQTEDRLRQVISRATLVWHEGSYAFREYPASTFPLQEVSGALAFVRDHDVWSVLARSDDDSVERFSLFSFHFSEGLDNSGFVGWLATLLKRELGTGVFVVCGQNQGCGGIFDYWGVPLKLASQAKESITALLHSA